MPLRPLVGSSPPPSPRSTTSSLTTPSGIIMNGQISPRTLAVDRNKASPRRRLLSVSPSRDRPPTGRNIVTRRSPGGSRIPQPTSSSSGSGGAERRDPWEEEEEEEPPTTRLIEYIRKRDWTRVASHIRTREGIEEVSQQLPTGDFPLHTLCQSEYKSSAHIQRRQLNPSIGSGGKDRPPHSLLVEVLQIYPEAVKTPNLHGSLPLHYAVQNAYPAAILHTLIRAYPQALDALDDRRWTPRDYLVTDDDPATRAILGRPTSCWLQQLRDEETQSNMQNELRDLELEVESLIIELEAAQREEAHLEECIRTVEKKLHASSYFEESADAHAQLQDFIQRLAQELQGELDELGDLLEIQSIQQLEKYERDEKERQYMATFNQDVERIYNNANAGLVELRDELERCKRTWG